MNRKSDKQRFKLPAVFISPPSASALARLCKVAERTETDGAPVIQVLLDGAAAVEHKLASQGAPAASDRPEWAKGLVAQSVQLHKLAILHNADYFQPIKRSGSARHESLAAMFAYGWYVAAARHNPRKSRIALCEEVARALGPDLTRFDVERLVACFEHRRVNLRRTDRKKAPGAQVEPVLAAAIEAASDLTLAFYGQWAHFPTVH